MTNMLTADTITDEQIQELETSLLATSHATEGLADYEACLVALRAPLGSLRRVQARARCAELLNARGKVR